jgi:serine/threonine protein kinase
MGETDGRYYITMRYIPGLSLDKHIREKGRMPWPNALQCAVQIGAALAHAHQYNVIHRDVKPQNIMISTEFGAVLTDFGLAKALNDSGLRTRSGGVVGTPQYIPVEVWNGEAATKASDQYALACVVSEILTGRILFQASTLEAIIRKHFTGTAEAWTPLPRNVPPDVEKVLRKALSADPAQRYPEVSTFIQALSLCRAAAVNEPPTRSVSAGGGPVYPSDTGPAKRSPSSTTPKNPQQVSSEIMKNLGAGGATRENARPDSKRGRRQLRMGKSGKAKAVPLTKKEVSIGRHPDCDLPIGDLEVSRRHARLVAWQGGYTIEDLDSANGTYVNDVRVKGRFSLKHGDVIRLGKAVEMVYEDQ